MKQKTVELKKTKEILIFNIPFFVGLVLNVLVVLMFSKTVIRLQDIFLLYITTGIVLYFIFDKFVKIKLSKFLRLAYTTVSFGSLLTCILLTINLYIYPTKDFEILKTPILKKGFTTKGNNPKADIEVDGIIKGVIFQNIDNINDYSAIELKVRKGRLGWKIIEKTTLIK
ncbi:MULTISPECIES: hypothetical protein [Flavobacterium]|uniref:hypothetical protein n=1 Tax=Flavobacterium TaxID=237 RepID=UPI001FCC1100|nr:MULTISPECIES: hypothetical protein [Flavobacterium]UOK42130.1 hypothetical protein LZF87_12525 [Flavobacterium enshiense]UOK42194.1 hypothetical protein LZF87_12855 [Flavobacterium enshiense]